MPKAASSNSTKPGSGEKAAPAIGRFLSYDEIEDFEDRIHAIDALRVFIEHTLPEGGAFSSDVIRGIDRLMRDQTEHLTEIAAVWREAKRESAVAAQLTGGSK